MIRKKMLSLNMLLNEFSLVQLTGSNYLLIESLVDESKREGYLFVQRTIENWNNGVNRFSKNAEGMWGLFSGTELIGMCGLNQDPYTEDAGTGRVRHLYVRQTYRRKGCATLLMNTIIEQARLHYFVLRLFTANPVAARFYEQLGFKPFYSNKVSHVLTL